MLKIWFYENKNAIEDTDGYFDSVFSPGWITQEDSIKMIKDIDKSNVIAENIIESPVLGTIPPQWLSGGVKTLILMNNLPGKIINADQLGDNCIEWLLKISEEKDIEITLFHLIDPFKEMDSTVNIKIMNSGKVVHTRNEYLDEYFEIPKA